MSRSSIVTSLFAPCRYICVRAATVAALACWHSLSIIISFHIRLCCDIMLWTVAFLTLPIRLLTAHDRERNLERLLADMQTQMDRLVLENEELEGSLLMAHKDQKVIETILGEIEEDYEKALSRIELLENQLQDMKEENMRLNECRGKSLWDSKARDDKDRNVPDALTVDTKFGISSWSAGGKNNVVSPWGAWETSKDEAQPQDLSKSTHPYSFSPEAVSAILSIDEVPKRGRTVALQRSLFGLIMSLAVGIIVWKAEGPCPPLIAALFSVVGMSTCSVIRFFSTIKNKRASDAVALLSLNWFIMGTLTSPMLPGLAELLVPHAVRLTEQLFLWFGFAT